MPAKKGVATASVALAWILRKGVDLVPLVGMDAQKTSSATWRRSTSRSTKATWLRSTSRSPSAAPLAFATPSR
jgi:hypothetical protein